MVRKQANKVRRTITIATTIVDNKNLMKEGLGRTRSSGSQKPLEIKKKIQKTQNNQKNKKNKKIEKKPQKDKVDDESESESEQQSESSYKLEGQKKKAPPKKKASAGSQSQKKDNKIEKDLSLEQKEVNKSAKKSEKKSKQTKATEAEKEPLDESDKVSNESEKKETNKKRPKKNPPKSEKKSSLKISEKKSLKVSEKKAKEIEDEDAKKAEEKDENEEKNDEKDEIQPDETPKKQKGKRRNNGKSSKKKQVTSAKKKETTASKKRKIEEKGEEEDREEQKEKEKQNNKEDKLQEQEEKQQVKPRRTESKATAGIVDVVFCCDTTASMGMYLNQAKDTVRTIVKNIKEKCSNEDISVRFGFVCYRDHPPQDHTYVTKVKDLCSDEEVIQFIQEQSAMGGGDNPEAVLDGLFDAATKINWRPAKHTPSLKYIFHIADAPPHGKEFGQQSIFSEGVPSGITLDKVVHVINIREIHYRLIKLSLDLNQMVQLFKDNFTNFEETTLTNAKELNVKVSDMIIRELLPDVDYND